MWDGIHIFICSLIKPKDRNNVNIVFPHNCAHDRRVVVFTLIARFRGPTCAHLGPTGPRWVPYWPHGLCYLCCFSYVTTVLLVSFWPASLALWQTHDCPNIGEATLSDMDRQTACIFWELLIPNKLNTANGSVFTFDAMVVWRTLSEISSVQIQHTKRPFLYFYIPHTVSEKRNDKHKCFVILLETDRYPSTLIACTYLHCWCHWPVNWQCYLTSVEL